LRTNEVVGILTQPPAVGNRMIIFSDSIDPEQSLRMISTSTILDVKHCQERCGEYWKVRTMYSTYLVERIDE
jgi:hypothetical protein